MKLVPWTSKGEFQQAEDCTGMCRQASGGKAKEKQFPVHGLLHSNYSNKLFNSCVQLKPKSSIFAIICNHQRLKGKI